jgi:hypothetical protein
MESLEQVRSIIESILLEYTRIPYAYGDFHSEAIFDRVRDRYVLMNVGWDNGRRVHGSLVHIDIIDGKLWIQRDGLEHGVASELIEAGIPKDRIVLAFKPPVTRKLIPEFAVA